MTSNPVLRGVSAEDVQRAKSKLGKGVAPGAGKAASLSGRAETAILGRNYR